MIEELLPFIAEFNEEIKSQSDFVPLNNYFMAGDADIYYSLIRKLEPLRIIEVGAGYSTIVARMAIKNRIAYIDAVEPLPTEKLKKFAEANACFVNLWTVRAQDIPIDFYSSLEAGDILFIDSSHIYTPGSDVDFLLKEVLPALTSGVYVHFHDIVLPNSYNELYSQVNWNEQDYVKELIDSPSYEVIWFGSKMCVEKPEVVKGLFPSYGEFLARYPKGRCSSLWLKKN